MINQGGSLCAACSWVAGHPSLSTMLLTWCWSWLGEAGKRHQGSDRALPQPRPFTNHRPNTQRSAADSKLPLGVHRRRKRYSTHYYSLKLLPPHWLSHLYLLSFFGVANCDIEMNTWMSESDSGWLISWVADFMANCFFYHAVFLELYHEIAATVCCLLDI